MTVQICMGSACHQKNVPEIIRLFQEALEEHGLMEEVALAGGFCMNRCGAPGVTVCVDDEYFTGVTVDGFRDFFRKNVLNKIRQGKE